MTRSASRAEEGLAGLRIADEDARRPVARFVVPRRLERVDEGGDVGNLFYRERELRHPAVGPAALDHRRHQLAVPIVEDDARSEQARTPVAPADVGTVAELAVRAVQAFAASDRSGIAGRALGVRGPRGAHDYLSSAPTSRALTRLGDLRGQPACQ